MVRNFLIFWVGSGGGGVVFSVELGCKEELNFMLKVSDFLSRCGGFEIRGTDFLLTNTLDLTLKESRNIKGHVIYFVSEKTQLCHLNVKE